MKKIFVSIMLVLLMLTGCADSTQTDSAPQKSEQELKMEKRQYIRNNIYGIWDYVNGGLSFVFCTNGDFYIYNTNPSRWAKGEYYFIEDSLCFNYVQYNNNPFAYTSENVENIMENIEMTEDTLSFDYVLGSRKHMEFTRCKGKHYMDDYYR